MTTVIMMGPPGAGKGTQGRRLSQQLGIPVVAMGDLLREKKNENSPLGKQLKQLMADGAYVPDEIVVGMLAERVGREDCRDGFILDGFPRTVGQADELDRMLEQQGRSLRAVLLLDVPAADLVERLSGRRICPQCKREYHVRFRPPQNDMRCDGDNAALIQRDDDHPETIRRRLQVYREQTEPLVAYYERKDLLRRVDGTGEFNQVYERLQEALA